MSLNPPETKDTFTFDAHFDPGTYDKLNKQLGVTNLSYRFPDGTSFQHLVRVTYVVHKPTSCWQKFKERWFPNWLKKFFPVIWEVEYHMQTVAVVPSE